MDVRSVNAGVGTRRVRPDSARPPKPAEGSCSAMNIVTSQPATAAPATGGIPVEGFRPEMEGYSENLASQPNNDAELPSSEKAARFEREVVPLHEVLYQHALHMCHNHADAEDLVQDTMVKAYSSFHLFVPDTNLKTWLYRIQTNTYIDGYRRKRR